MTSNDQFNSAKNVTKQFGSSNISSSSDSNATGANKSLMTSNVKPPECFGCHKPIVERYLLKALEQVWHEDCLKCSCCDCRLGEIGSTLFTRANMILCKRDYLRLFGTTGLCSSCNKQIPAFEMVMRARGMCIPSGHFTRPSATNASAWHRQRLSPGMLQMRSMQPRRFSPMADITCALYACVCMTKGKLLKLQRFCVGDRFYLHENKILCEYDYEEQMALNQIHQQRQYYHSLEQASKTTTLTHECHTETECTKGKSYPTMLSPSLGSCSYS